MPRSRLALALALALTLAPPCALAAKSPARPRDGAAQSGAQGQPGQTAPAAPSPSPAPAVEADPDRRAASEGPGVLAPIGWALGLGAALGGLAWALRRWPPTARWLGQPGELAVLGRLALGPRHALCLVQAGQVKVLLAVGPQGVSAVHVWPAAATQSGEQGQRAADRAAADGGQRSGQRPAADWPAPGQLDALRSMLAGRRARP